MIQNLARVDVSIIPISLWWSDTPVSNVRVFIKQAFSPVRKFLMHVELILLKCVGSDIRAESSWASVHSIKFGLSRVMLKSLVMSWLIKCQDIF